MRVYENWTEEDLRREFERLTMSGRQLHRRALEAATLGGDGWAQFHDYEFESKKQRNQANQITREMRHFRGYKNFPNDFPNE
ncbi:hypothetical protein LLE49_18995 [Alicyclobacillus tolerans]|uniref:hypothetical protein n=1 Tax=Alicyclobacillus tolerans TaxID=90970 RepID=UPI001F42A22E|nr:hypothetical protein [Alicyclobacillus tolerans]MCF8566812.1 hypothetical protein [Alicyclobacillus tolerans]